MTPTPETDIYAVAFYPADHAAVESGKVYASGACWDRLRFASFPAIFTFSLVAVLHIPWRAYHQRHVFKAWFEDADGKKVGGDLEGEFQVGAAPEMKVGDPTIMPIAASIGNFAFQQAGSYSAVLQVDGTEIARWPFHALQAVAPGRDFRPPSPIDLPPTE